MEDPQAKPQMPEGDSSTEPAPGKRRWLNLKGLVSRKALISILVASLVIHGAGMWYYMAVRASVDPASLETSLGEFHYEADNTASAVVRRAQFQLHISLLPEVRRTARSLLTTRQYKVQQDIEQLMRQASGGDFEEPTLSELKRQLREQINNSLGIKAVDEVIITDLSLEMPAAGDEPPIDVPFIGSSETPTEPAG